MPDADEAGSSWLKAVIATLEAEGIQHRVVSFADAGCKDLTEFMVGHSVEELVHRCGDWVRMPKMPVIRAQDALGTIATAG
jgi:hypothetical protein